MKMSRTEERGLLWVAIGNGRPPTLPTKLALNKRGLIRKWRIGTKHRWVITDAGNRALDAILDRTIREVMTQLEIDPGVPVARYSKRGQA